MTMIPSLLDKNSWNKEDLITLLKAEGPAMEMMLQRSAQTRERYIGNKIYLRGLLEISNICSKNCYYCGIRYENRNIRRYKMTLEEVEKAVRFAYEQGFGSVVFQSGEIEAQPFTEFVTRAIAKTKDISGGRLGITLSCGEQSDSVYRQWKEAGAHRYLLRIEASDPDLFKKLHPTDDIHNLHRRMEALRGLQRMGYQTGTGVMIGLPFQTLEHLANDLLFMREFDIDMVGMGPYVMHRDTPLFEHRHEVPLLKDRISLSLKMIAILRLMMKDVNIASTTALSAIDPMGKIMGMKAGANVIMPNITPAKFIGNYNLYDNKPYVDLYSNASRLTMEKEIENQGFKIGFDEWGDSVHYRQRTGS